MNIHLIRELIIDVVGIGGLVMLGYGLWQVSPIYMFIIIGIILVSFALLASRSGDGGGNAE